MSVFRHFFPLWGNISPYTYRGTYPKARTPFHFTAKAKLIYKSNLLFVVLRQEREKIREVFDDVRGDRFIYGLWHPFFPTKPNGFAP